MTPRRRSPATTATSGECSWSHYRGYLENGVVRVDRSDRSGRRATPRQPFFHSASRRCGRRWGSLTTPAHRLEHKRVPVAERPARAGVRVSRLVGDDQPGQTMLGDRHGPHRLPPCHRRTTRKILGNLFRAHTETLSAGRRGEVPHGRPPCRRTGLPYGRCTKVWHR